MKEPFIVIRLLGKEEVMPCEERVGKRALRLETGRDGRERARHRGAACAHACVKV